MNWSAALPRDVGVVIVAAGGGTRFGGEVPKQFLELGGVPILLHAIRPFASHPSVATVAVVLPQDDAARPPAWLGDLSSAALVVVAGGATRRASVAAGLAALDAQCEVVLVHDGARPFPPREAIDQGIAIARTGHAAVPGLPVADTLKRADEGGRVLATVARAGLWRAQTPQAFPRLLLERAHAAEVPRDLVATDDAMLVELVGGRVDLVPGSKRNIKITTADDLLLAGWLLGQP
jgi:2-C-methyl-D-erythritol 4-phosphate cytidylyltransferase